MEKVISQLTYKLADPTDEDLALISRAYYFAKNAHGGQRRFTGEPYFNHAFETAKILALWNMDTITIVAGLLHDTIEDTPTTEEGLKKEFSEEVVCLVNGVTKLGTLRYRGVERHVESLRKLFVATADDVRVLIIKLADRLHNIKTLHAHKNEDKKRRIALETIELYAPLASRLGMIELKGDLEDFAFTYTQPEDYEETTSLLKQKTKKDKVYLQKVKRSLQKQLAKNNIVDVEIGYRIKHIYSLYKKLQRKEKNIDAIFDIIALRVIVPTIEDCYSVLGIIHRTWKPVPGKVKDYIANPKTNGYRSLHTTIFTGDGGITEIQIRTKQMHVDSEYGMAAHHIYKSGEKIEKKSSTNTLNWLSYLREMQNEEVSSQDFIAQIKADIFEDSIFVMTPKGDAVELPREATVLDFAYAIHSDIGDHAQGAHVNKKYVAINAKLKHGDIVEVSTNKKNHPTQKWLDMAETNMAKRHIRSYISKK